MNTASWLHPAAHPDDAADDLGFIGWGGEVELEWFKDGLSLVTSISPH